MLKASKIKVPVSACQQINGGKCVLLEVIIKSISSLKDFAIVLKKTVK